MVSAMMASPRVMTGFLAFFAAAHLAGAASPLTFLRPAPGSTVTGRTIVEVAVAEGTGITNLDVKLDGATIATGLRTPPFVVILDTRPLLSSVHTLLAVAKDHAGTVIKSEILSFNTANPPQYTLAPGPYVVEDLGSPMSGNIQQRLAMFRDGTEGDYHLLLYYHTTRSGDPSQLVDVNLTRGTAHMTNMPSGTPGVHATVYYPANGRIYMANNRAMLFEYTPATGASNNAISLSGYGGNMEIGDDGFIYIGTAGGMADRYNPTSHVYQALGKLDPTATNIDQYEVLPICPTNGSGF